MAKVEQSKEFRKWFKNIRKLVDRKTVSEAIKKSPAGKELINVIIAQAKAGLGPMQQQYANYSPEYAKRKGKAGQKGVPFWLRGVGNTGRAGGMLDPANFDYEIGASGALFLVWTPKVDPKTANYANVHQMGNATTPMRKWMHVRNVASAKAVTKLYTIVFKALTTKILSGGNL